MEKLKIVNSPCLASKNSDEVKDYIAGLIDNNIGGYSVAINAEKVVMYNKNKEVKEIIDNCILPTIDGEGVPWGIKLIYKKTTNKVDLPVTVMQLANSLKLRVFFLGSTEQNNKIAVDNVRKKYPNIQVVGRHDGYFKDFDYIKDILVEANPQIVLLALGSPKQELLSAKLKEFVNSTIFICGGGAINVLAGKRKRPPQIIMNSKVIPLEWLYVLITDPNWVRIKRQLALPVFFYYIIRDMIKFRLFNYSND